MMIANSLRALAVPIDSIYPDPNNVRRHPAANLEAIRASLRRYGQRKPIVINRRTRIVEAGNGLLNAAKAEGWTEIAAIFVDDDEVTATGYAVADNRTAELAEWDDAALAQVLEALKQEGELAFTGFDEAALDRLLRDLMPREETFNVVEALKAAPELAEKVKPGQVWRLGQHRLMCGDSTNATDVARFVNGAQVDFLFTSPPYNVGVEYESHEDATVPWEQYGAFLRAALEAWLPALRLGRAIGWNVGVSPKTHHVQQYGLLESLGFTFVRQMIWKKVGVPVPAWYHTIKRARARYFTPNYVHELIWIFSRGELQVGNPIEIDPLCEYDVFEIAQSQATVDLPPGDQHTGVRSNLDRRSFKAHPSAFPVPLPRMFITHLCDVGEIVVDPFLGSGSTIIAAEQASRVCYGVEIDPLYCAVAIARWESFTGESAVPE